MPEVLRLFPGQPVEGVGADGHRGDALLLQLHRVVDTPRRARPSVADGRDDGADLLRVDVELLGAHGGAGLLLGDDGRQRVSVTEPLRDHAPGARSELGLLLLRMPSVTRSSDGRRGATACALVWLIATGLSTVMSAMIDPPPSACLLTNPGQAMVEAVDTFTKRRCLFGPPVTLATRFRPGARPKGVAQARAGGQPASWCRGSRSA